MNRPKLKFVAGSRRGIALIITLGMLSVLMVLAVSFAISMRTEQSAAGNYYLSVKQRQLVHAALARAMEDIDQSLSNLNVIYPVVDTNSPYSWTYAMPAQNNFDWLELETLLPSSIVQNSLKLINDQCFIGSITNSVGQAGYMVVNVSGLLDPNYVYNGARGLGLNAGEIQIDSQMADIPGAAGVAAISNNRPYETMYDLVTYAGLTNAVNFFTYSRFPKTPGSNQVIDLSVDAVSIAGNRGDIMRELRNAGLYGAEALYAFRNLVDYVDGDRLPGNEAGNRSTDPSGPYVEAVPMINEVRLRADFTFTTNGPGYNCQVEFDRMWFECFYPFVWPTAPAGYKFNCDITIDGATDPVGSPYTWSSGDLPVNITDNYWSRFRIPTPAKDTTTNMAAQYTLDVELDMQVKDGDDVVIDQVSGLVMTFEVTPSVGPAIEKDLDMQCNDPRLNHLAGSWSTNSPTLTAPRDNVPMLNYFTNSIADGDKWMYSADSPVRSPGELGYIFIGKPWETIRLYDRGDGFHRVFDYFYCSETGTVSNARHGLVNPNSDMPEALAAVFNKMPMDEYPGGPSDPAGGVAWINALGLANELFFDSSVFSFDSLSDLGESNIAARIRGELPASANDSELRREAFYRNCGNLLNPRQNLFVILLRGFSAGSDVKWVAEQRAMAVVWRDPFTGNAFVRWFTWLKR